MNPDDPHEHSKAAGVIYDMISKWGTEGSQEEEAKLAISIANTLIEAGMLTKTGRGK